MNQPLQGWFGTQYTRHLGSISFASLTANGETTELVFESELAKLAEQIKPFSYIQVNGEFRSKPTNQEQEFHVSAVTVLSQPIEHPAQTIQHLRKIQPNLRARAQALAIARQVFQANGFLEVETPILAEPTEGGAETFKVSGTSYSLPQSPQLYKQTLIAGGIEKYYQIAKCFRSEAMRSNRQPEFTQLDAEMVTASTEELMAIAQNLVAQIYTELAGTEPTFQTLTYEAAIAQFGTAEPTLGKHEFLWITELPLFKPSEPKKAFHHPFTLPTENGNSAAFELIYQGMEIGGGSLRIHSLEQQIRVFAELGFAAAEISQNFEILLEALEAGIPPHGGFAIGLERLLMISLEEKSIKNAIAFPK